MFVFVFKKKNVLRINFHILVFCRNLNLLNNFKKMSVGMYEPFWMNAPKSKTTSRCWWFILLEFIVVTYEFHLTALVTYEFHLRSCLTFQPAKTSDQQFAWLDWNASSWFTRGYNSTRRNISVLSQKFFSARGVQHVYQSVTVKEIQTLSEIQVFYSFLCHAIIYRITKRQHQKALG